MTKAEIKTAEIKEVIVEPRHIRVGVVGPMGSGKSTLMSGFREEWPDAVFVDEIFLDNPYMADQYKGREGFAFKSQIRQFGTKMEQLKEVKADRLSLFVPLLQDVSYAEAYLSGDDLATYLHLCNLSLELRMVPQPDVILSLVIEDNALVQRVKARDRDFERNVDPKFLARLNQIMTINCAESGIPVIPVDAQYQDFRSPRMMVEIVESLERQIYEELKEKLDDPKSGLLRPSFIEKKGVWP
ncbi:deoxynucleoside kinase [Candidatus Woesebacteria bacterium]|nr:deoxynucleoside kinase [Candidatus Woesebacteria bacterium]